MVTSRRSPMNSFYANPDECLLSVTDLRLATGLNPVVSCSTSLALATFKLCLVDVNLLSFKFLFGDLY
jgi:hypothetical protein